MPQRIAALANEPCLNVVKLAYNDSGNRPGAIDRLVLDKVTNAAIVAPSRAAPQGLLFLI